MKSSIGTFVLLLCCISAQASLGEKATKLEQNTNIRTQTHSSFQIRESSQTEQLLIREFIGPDETVFGIAWEGMHLPDFAKVLGSHFREFEAFSNSGQRRRGPLYVTTENLVVFSGGQQRHFKGHAYLKNLIPQDVSNEVIK